MYVCMYMYIYIYIYMTVYIYSRDSAARASLSKKGFERLRSIPGSTQVGFVLPSLWMLMWGFYFVRVMTSCSDMFLLNGIRF